MTPEQNIKQRLVLCAYEVTYVDLRDPKPRTVKTDLPVYCDDALKGLDLMGLSRVEYIKHNYEMCGYHVCEVKKKPRKVAYVELAPLYKAAVDQEEPAEIDMNSAVGVLI